MKTENVMLFLAGLMPKRLIYWCSIKLIAYSTTGKYGNTIVPELTAMEALNRYGKDHRVEK